MLLECLHAAKVLAGGNKEKRLRRLVSHEKVRCDPNRHEIRLKDFLTPTHQAARSAQPTLHAHYVKYFNLVDRFDAMMGHIPVTWKVDTFHMRIFLAAISTALCNTWVLSMDIANQIHGPDAEKNALRLFARELADEIDREYTK
jgi:hypothetical protein